MWHLKCMSSLWFICNLPPLEHISLNTSICFWLCAVCSVNEPWLGFHIVTFRVWQFASFQHIKLIFFAFLWFCVNYTMEEILSQAWVHRHEVRFIWAVAAERRADLVWGRWASPTGAVSLYLIFYCFMCQTISMLIRLNWAKAFVEIIKRDFIVHFSDSS